MARGIYRHFTLDRLLAMRDSAMEAASAGDGRLLSASAGDVNIAYQQGMSAEQILEEINYALELRDPAMFPPPVTRTTPRFLG